MADPIPPVVNPDDNANLAAQADLAGKASEALSGFTVVAGQAKNVFADLQTKIQGVSISFKNNQELTQNQTQALGLLTTSLVGARAAFEGLSGVDTSGLNTFSGQIKDLQDIMANSPAYKLAKKALEDVTAAAAGFAPAIGAAMIKKAQEEFKSVTRAVSETAITMATSADNAMRLQNAFIQLSAKTGNLNAIYSAAGPNLEKINFLLQNQQKAVTDAATATQLPIAAVEKYYSELGSIPKALEENVKSSDAANRNVSMLTASIQYAAGSGRSYADVIADLKVAFQDYNLVGEKALQFTARMGELSNKFGVELSDVQGSLRTTAENFKMFGNEAEGAARMMNQYLGALEDTGISGHVALGVIQDMTAGIKGMGLAQKGFLSAQTGGPGGLMGAFQIEKMLREGKLDEVMDKVKQTLTKQFGQITTLEEASKSPAAAAQLTKQMLMLRQGPLGAMAKDDQSAMRLLEAMKGGEGKRAVGDQGALGGAVVQDSMKVGVELQKKSVTELSRIRAAIEGARGQASMSNYGAAQQAFTAGTGTPLEGADFNSKMRLNLSDNMMKGAVASGDTTAMNKKDIKLKDVKDRAGVFGVQMVDDFKSLFDELSPALQGPINKIKDMMQSGQAGKVDQAKDDMKADIARRKAEVEILPPEQQASAMADIRRDEDLSQRAIAAIPPASMAMRGPKGLGGASDLGVAINGPGLPAGEQVGQAASQVATRGPGATDRAAGTIGRTSMMPTPPAASAGELTVRVEGICLDCHQKALQGASQRLASSPASGISK
jgi:hypothetical protein